MWFTVVFKLIVVVVLFCLGWPKSQSESAAARRNPEVLFR